MSLVCDNPVHRHGELGPPHFPGNTYRYTGTGPPGRTTVRIQSIYTHTGFWYLIFVPVSTLVEKVWEDTDSLILK